MAFSQCEYGLRPYPDQTTNALNPCFLSAVSLGHAAFFSIIGVFQLTKLLQETRKPASFKYSSTLRSLSTRHLLHLSNVGLQATLFLCLLMVLPTDDTPKITEQSVLCQLLLVVFVNIPTQFIQYYRSTASLAGQLFYFLTQTLLMGYQIGQRLGHHPDTRFDVFPGQIGALLELALFANGLSIFLYDLVSFRPSPELVAYYSENELNLECNIFENITFTWMNRLIGQVYRDGEIKDPHNMPIAPINLNVKEKAALLKSKWENERWSGRNSLFWAIMHAFGKIIALALSIEIFKDFLTILQPQLLRLFISEFDVGHDDAGRTHPMLNAVFVALALFLLKLLSTCLSNQFFIIIFEAGMSIRGGLMTMLYQKSLSLSGDAREAKSAGDIMNLMAVDVIRIQRFFETSQDLIGSPIALITTLISLYTFLGNATIGGILVMAVMFPVNSFLSRKVKKYVEALMKYKDARIKTITEILNSVKTVKLYAWEKPMLEKLDHVRNEQELKSAKVIAVLTNLILLAWNCVPILVASSTFLIYAVTMDKPLSPEIVFPSLSLFDILNDCIYTIPRSITNFIETGVSIGRLKDFFLATELDNSFIKREELPEDPKMPVIEIDNATFLRKAFVKPSDDYDEEAVIESAKVALTNISFRAYKAQLVCIVGRVGNGKSTFLQALMGMLPCISASEAHRSPVFHFRANSVALCSQQAWIMNASVKDNILFGHRYDETYYNATVKACQLLPDLEILADGDETLVGEKGISLSGGQKARLSLARAVYSRADVYLLDDILSAVDAQVSRHITDEVLSREKGLLKNKTVILTTNSTSVLKHAQTIWAIEDGTFIESGSFDDILNKGTDSKLNALINDIGLSDSNEAKESSQQSLLKIQEDQEYDVQEEIGLTDPVEGENVVRAALQSRKASMATLRPRKIIDINTDTRRTKQKEEKKERGRVKGEVYRAYLKACGIPGAIIFFIFLCGSRALLTGENFWLKHWSEDNQKNGENVRIAHYVGIYVLISLGAAFFNNVKNIFLLLVCSMRASRILHDNMASAVLRSPMSFFETTPIGRIINRFSSDMNSVDDNVQYVISFFLLSVLDYIVVVIVIGYQVPLFLIVNGLLLVLYLYYQVYYVTLSRELKRLISTSFSPIMSMLSETIAGHLVIHAFDHFERFDYFNLQNVQFNVNCVFNFRSTNRWLSVRLESIGAFMILAVAILSLSTTAGDSPLSAGMVGLLMSCALQVTNRLMWIVRMSVQLETNIVSVERIVEYCKLTPEAPAIIEKHRPEKNWPARGSIKFENYSTRYRSNLDPVLKNLTANVLPQEKIGIVGRTGAGKSTLSLALFRILEPSEGTITIDGVDISQIGLFDLRSNLAIIPQDAQAFEGTIRSNIDPFNNYTDEEVWKALELSHLKPHVVKMAKEEAGFEGNDNLLDTKVSENGSNFSVGQRQLLCLSRALLNHSKILILDEATAAVDSETDRLIQETIRAEFKDRTILTIAHRIDTVLDSDKIMVLDKGELKEFDSPANLLADKNSIFYSLCEQGGYLKTKT